eukprot:CAMPEP_0118929144 /NCGR_PEP_ID=MMETSP1169-20130426/6230_1 /TAXON_ID=36882 /ORGANISM="Pyramimonas obovata, Strain CCMP722" /LENGTH=229 /DNA_ID=CAMNT_0006871279 /DNA_START=35 /DNA_END=721 /DNA_ORIENTATION=-
MSSGPRHFSCCANYTYLLCVSLHFAGVVNAKDIYLPNLVSSTGLSKPVRQHRERPLAPGCNAEAHTDYGGDPAFVWGMNFKVRDAAECCEACKAHARKCTSPETQGRQFWKPTISGEGRCGGHLLHGQPVVCNTWVYCGEQQCFSFDIHNHSRGECWLKHVTNPERPEPWNGGDFPPVMRAAPRQNWPWAVAKEVWPYEMPEKVSWIAGVLTPPGGKVVHHDPEDRPDW